MPEITIRHATDIIRAGKWVMSMAEKGLPGGPVVITADRESRTIEQNSKLWPMLTDISKQVDWYGKHSPEVWKDLITGTFRQCQVLPNLDGTGFVTTGLSTSKMNKRDFSALIEYIYSYGADQGIIWSEKSLEAFEEYREAKQ